MQISIDKLMKQFAGNGKVEWIGIRPEKKATLRSVMRVMLDPTYGVQGDHYAGRSGKRQVSLLQAEHLPVIASIMQCASVAPEQLRRNILISGINLLALKDKTFQIGEAVLEFTGLCHPCSRMQVTLGHGGYNAMRGHGGITARVIHPGEICVGDVCCVLENRDEPPVGR